LERRNPRIIERQQILDLLPCVWVDLTLGKIAGACGYAQIGNFFE